MSTCFDVDLCIGDLGPNKRPTGMKTHFDVILGVGDIAVHRRIAFEERGVADVCKDVIEGN